MHGYLPLPRAASAILGVSGSTSLLWANSRFIQTSGMDYGHYNCRDYHISPHFAATTIVQERSSFSRHESFDELELRSRSPASLKPKFPLLKLPLELREQIFSYLLPRTRENADPNPLANHARTFSAVKKRGERGMNIPKPSSHRGPSHVVWRRGNINLLCVCRQLHDECANLLYGKNTFLLFVTYSGITFRFSWIFPTGMTPSRTFDFLELLPRKYMVLIKRMVVNVDHVDSYTGMIKFNVSGKGLTHGLRKQVLRLVTALRQPSKDLDSAKAQDVNARVINNSLEISRLAKVDLRVSNGYAFLDQITTRQRDNGGGSVSKDLEEILEPFSALRGVREVAISGAVTDEFASSLENTMKSLVAIDSRLINDRANELDDTISPHLCVYGNDI